MIEYGDGAFRHGWPGPNLDWVAGRLVATSSPGQVWSFDAETGALQPVDPAALVRGSLSAFSVDGQHLAVATADAVTVESLDFHAEIEGASSIAWAPDGARLAVGTDLGTSGRVWIFHLDGSATIELKGARGAVEDIRWKSDGTQLAARTMSTAYRWLAEGGKAVTLLKGKKYVKLAGWHGELAIVVDSGQSVHGIEPSDATASWTLPGGDPSVANDEVIVTSRLGETHVIVDGAVERTMQMPLAPSDLALDPAGHRIAVGDPRILVSDIDDLETVAAPAHAGHGSHIKAVSEHGDHFSTVAGDHAACVWKRGEANAVTRIQTGILEPTKAVAIGDNTMWVGAGKRVLRFDWSGGSQVSSPTFKKEVTIVRRVGAVVVVVTQAHRSSKGQILILDPATLQVQFEAETGERLSHSVVVSDGSLRLVSEQAYLDLNLQGSVSDAVASRPLGVPAGEAASFPGFRLRHLRQDHTVEVLAADDDLETNQYPIIECENDLYLSTDAEVLVVPGADQLAFYIPTTGEVVGSYPIDRRVSFMHEFDDGALLVTALDGWLAELPSIQDMIAASA